MNLSNAHNPISTRSIRYKQLFHSYVEATPLPALILNRVPAICYFNAAASRLDLPVSLSAGLDLAQVVTDEALLSLVHESIENGAPRKGTFDYGGRPHAWRVSITPLTQERRRTSAESPPPFLLSLSKMAKRSIVWSAFSRIS